MLIGEKIKSVRESKGITRYRLSKNTNIPYTTLTDVESGKVKDITSKNLMLVSQALNVPITELLEV